MKPFNLEEFKAGKKAVTRGRQIATFGGYNPDADGNNVLVGWVDGYVMSWRDNGRFLENIEDEDDLIGMAPEKKTVWVNVYKSVTTYNIAVVSNGYESKEVAVANSRNEASDYICTTSFEIEV